MRQASKRSTTLLLRFPMILNQRPHLSRPLLRTDRPASFALQKAALYAPLYYGTDAGLLRCCCRYPRQRHSHKPCRAPSPAVKLLLCLGVAAFRWHALTPCFALPPGGIHAVRMSSFPPYRTTEGMSVACLPGFSPAKAGLQPGFSIKGFIRSLPPNYSRTPLLLMGEAGTWRLGSLRAARAMGRRLTARWASMKGASWFIGSNGVLLSHHWFFRSLLRKSWQVVARREPSTEPSSSTSLSSSAHWESVYRPILSLFQDTTTSPAVQLRRVKSSIASLPMEAPGSSSPHSPTLSSRTSTKPRTSISCSGPLRTFISGAEYPGVK